MQSFYETIDRYEGIRDAIFELAQSALLRRYAWGKIQVKLKDPHAGARPGYLRLGFRASRTIRGIGYMERRIER